MAFLGFSPNDFCVGNTIFKLKEIAENDLQQGRYQEALDSYSAALALSTERSSQHEEIPKLLCNRSLVCFKMGNYQEALEDATNSIKDYPYWIKGFWRGCQAAKAMGDTQEAIKILNAGIGSCILNSASIEDYISCYAEMANILCQFKGVVHLPENAAIINPPDVNAKVRILQRLIKTMSWEAVSYLVTGKCSGNNDVLGRSFEDVNFSFINVGNLLNETTDIQQKYWGIDLAMALLSKGAPYQKMELSLGMPAIHIGVSAALKTGSLDFLKFLLSTYVDSTVMKDIINQKGDSAVHVVVKYGMSNTTLGKGIIKLLLNSGCTCYLKDMDGKMPIEYLKPTDQGYKLLQTLKQNAEVVPDSQQLTQNLTESQQSNLTTSNGMQPKEASEIPVPNHIGVHDTSNSQSNSQALKERGNIEFKKGNYILAASFYTRAIEGTGISGGCEIEQNHDLAVLYGNRSECSLKMGELDLAMNDASLSVHCDVTWFKGYMRVGKVFGAQGYHERALGAFTNALNRLAVEPSSEKHQREILSNYCTHYISLDRDKYPIDRKANVRVLPHVWTMVAYDFSARGNLDVAFFSYIQFMLFGMPSIVKEKFNLQHLCVYQHVEKHPWLIELIEYFLSCGSDVKTIKTDPADKYFHSTVRLTVASRSSRLLEYVINGFVRPLHDENLQDDNGNTALHTITRATNVDGQFRHKIIIRLLQCNVSPMICNKDQCFAVQYLPEDASMSIQILQHQMKQHEEMEKRKKQDQLQERHQQETRRQQNFRKQNITSLSGKLTRSDRTGILQQTLSDISTCVNCSQVLEDCREMIKDKPSSVYNDMAAVMKKKNHDKDRHEKIIDQMIQLITESIAATLNPEIPKKLVKINSKYYKRIVKGLIEEENWRQLHVAVKEHQKCYGPAVLADYAKGINIQRVITHSLLKQSQQLMSKIIESMLKSGAVMDNEGQQCIQAAVKEEHYKILKTLYNNGASPSHLSVNQGDTPIHAALSVAVERDKDAFSVFEKFLEMFEKDPEKFSMCDPNQVDSNGDSLFHLLAKTKYNATVKKAIELLCNKKVSFDVKNKDGKLPIYYLKGKDYRHQYFKLPSSVGTSRNRKGKGSKKKKKRKGMQGKTNQNGDEEEDCQQCEKLEETLDVAKSDLKQLSKKEALRIKIEKLINELPVDSADYTGSKKSSRAEENRNKQKENAKSKKKEPEVKVTPQAPQIEENTMETKMEDESEEEDNMEEQFTFDSQAFENLDWEVACTANVWKTLSDKHVPLKFKQKIVNIIQRLARGERTRAVCKKLHHDLGTLSLFEAKISKATRLIWEEAIEFSPRRSESPKKILERNDSKDQTVRGGRIYSEIIRVWDVVLDHDKIYASVQRIVKSHIRGESCIIQKKLKGLKHEKYSNEQKKVPRTFAEAEIEEGALEELRQLSPPASANDTEFHILKFYSFSSNLVSCILQNIEIKVDFPFRVTEFEHAIINLQLNAPILLLGRSGTGKTTCCLYRMWSQFVRYWTKAKEADAPLLPRQLPIKHQEANEEDFNQNKDPGDHKEELQSVPDGIERLPESTDGACSLLRNEGEEEITAGQHCDHLHQIFITKNAVLCNEVKTNFRELMHASDFAKNHVEVETQNLPYKLQDVSEYQFPLFVTSRQLLLMLDASLEPPYYFERSKDGSLKVDIQGWTDGDGSPSILRLLQENSDEETDSDEKDDPTFQQDDDERNENRRLQKKKDPRREITYELFAETIWPRINKGVEKKYHPSLVWTEIISFIKGSYEALSKPSGHLEEQEYIDLGRKRAPNFSGNREEIYTLFKKYKHEQKQMCLFDETDLVRHIYHRVCKMEEIDWTIHKIFVDETQDFTQAELCLLLRICQNPNDMFLTGDTAQSIMRGISFRFCDLQSLFHYESKQIGSRLVKGKASEVTIPKEVYKLTHNYRSHAGILSLASSIIDLMDEFFPETFDRLGKDQGLFRGPKPVVLESCRVSDLALLLRGNKRKTSHIEFGAHQAILVVNEAARRSIPEELQYGLILTIYESKGLEFDDILLYNFFKDSQASKEWRVVTDFLDRSEIDNDAPGTESLIHVSTDKLQQKDRPRALTFDSNLHKVLNSELKHLYTAVTRARVNVWIFDEDIDKRAPMFEYFKAKGLVRTITTDEAQCLSDAGMFAEVSTPEEWVKRAEEFMRHKLYEVAAKCFHQGNDPVNENIAMSHHRALCALRLKDHPIKMTEEFMLAALQYLEVRMPTYAAKCLHNAKERMLAAQLYEKIGQLELAAETYRKLHRPIESSACYERGGHYDKAVDILVKNQMFGMAVDSVKRWNKKKEEFDNRGESMPQHLKEHAPLLDHTLEKLFFMGAEMYHKNNNVEKMLAYLNRLSIIQDRVTFLKKHNEHNNGYMAHAIQILRDNGKDVEASLLYLEQGMVNEALGLARQIGRKDLIGYCLILQARLECDINPYGNATTDNDENIKKNVEEAFHIFKILQRKKGGCSDFMHPQTGGGEASLLLGQLTNDIKWIKKSFGAFNQPIPCKNEAAQLECMNWMVYNSDLSTKDNLFKVVKGMENLYGVLKILLSANIKDQYRLFRFYGLEPSSVEKLSYIHLLKPRIVNILKSCGLAVKEKNGKCEILVSVAKEKIAQFLLTRGKGWYSKIKDSIDQQYKMLGECSLYSVGILNQCKDPCDSGRHTRMSDEAFNDQINLYLLYIEMVSYVDCGARGCQMSKKVKKIQDAFYPPLTAEYDSFLLPLNDLLKSFSRGEGIVITKDSQIYHCRKRLLRDRRVFVQIDQMTKMLKKGYDKIKDKKNKMREKYTDFVMKEMFLIHFFSHDKVDVVNELCALENAIKIELNKKLISTRDLKDLGFLVEQDSVFALVRRFMEAFDHLSNNQPHKAVQQFSTFIQLIRKPNHKAVLPDIDLLMMWIEFYMVVSFCLDMSNAVDKNLSCLLPSSYLSVVNVVETCYVIEKGVSIFAAINRIKSITDETNKDLIKQRTEKLVGIIAGTDGKINLIRLAFHRLSKAMASCQPLDRVDPAIEKVKYTPEALSCISLAERVFVASLVFLCNMDKTVLKNSEPYVMREICRIKLPNHCPERLSNAVKTAQKAEGIADIVDCLRILLPCMNARLLHCWWQPRHIRWEGIVLETNIALDMFNQGFYYEQTLEVIRNPDKMIVTQTMNDDEEITMTTEEEAKLKKDQKIFEETQKKCKAAKTILKFYKHVKFVSNCRILKKLCARQIQIETNSGVSDILRDELINEMMCGICGEDFITQDEDDMIDRGVISSDDLVPTSTTNQDTFRGMSHVFSGIQGLDSGLLTSLPQTPSPQPAFKVWPVQTANNSAPSKTSSTSAWPQTTSNSAIPQTASDSASLQSNFRTEFPSLSESNVDRLSGLTPLQKHLRTIKHLTMTKDFNTFQNRYNTVFKKVIDEVETFIETHGLRTQKAANLNSGFDIIKLLNAYDQVVKSIRSIMQNQQWRDNNLDNEVQEMAKYHSQVVWCVREQIQSNSESIQDEDFDEDDQIVDVVSQPRSKGKAWKN